MRDRPSKRSSSSWGAPVDTATYANAWREREEPIFVSGKKVRALMAEEGCVVPYAKKRRRYSSYKGEIGDAPDNIVDRNFHASAPNELWLTDVTQLSIPAVFANLNVDTLICLKSTLR